MRLNADFNVLCSSSSRLRAHYNFFIDDLLRFDELLELIRRRVKFKAFSLFPYQKKRERCHSSCDFTLSLPESMEIFSVVLTFTSVDEILR